MPRRKDLPDALDPQVREFVTRLRRIADGSGADPAALADGTGYGEASWERYLDGRLLAPKGAVVALAEVTGTDPVPLITLWELAERAWSRSELRHGDATEAVLLSRARTVTAPASGPGRPARRPAVFLAGALGAVTVTVGAFLLTDGGPADSGRTAARTPAPSATPAPGPPPGVRCVGSGCTGKDPERTGCADGHVTTARSVTVGAALLEVRYNDTCGAAWGRLTGAVPGDTVRVTAGGTSGTGGITGAGETIAYTPMAAVKEPGELRACAELASGERGCA